MSTHKYIDKICCVVLALTLILTVLFMNAEAFGIKSASGSKGYEARLFDTSCVHTLNIVIDDWEGFLADCTDEEYVSCSVVIDNEAYKNVAIRAKGNTSLSNVKNYGNDRYSFKIEFDHYDSTKSYYGLDKLSLNNIIQDNTYIKDYLCYQMMGYFGVDAPLCSFVQINVNGEEWGLYLAVEGVEDSFLERNYGKDYGELYKPDSQSMGGGRGNGDKFDMDEWDPDEDMPDMSFSQDGTGKEADWNKGGMQRPEQGNFGFGGDGMMQAPDGMMSFTLEDAKKLMDQLSDEDLEQIVTALGYESISELYEALDDAETLEELLNGKDMTQIAELFRNDGNMGGFFGDDGQFDANINTDKGNMGDMGGGMGGGMGSNDVKLVYTDDSYSSYSNIFENAKTDITDKDKDRLIASLKLLNENSNIEEVVNVDEVIRYFVVHNFVCNFDSYTGSMIHNYYLYEEDGKFSMIPWDYNLAFGGFVGGSDAASLVNYPIDSPVYGGTTDSRPMIAWIFNNEEYTELYHKYFAEFTAEYFDSGYFAEMIDSLKEMISPYVESDPTKFCTYEEFEKGIETLKEFCLLRAESVSGQLNGTIPSTSDAQAQDQSSLVSAADINISDMGNMSGSMGGGMDRPSGANNGQGGEAQPDNGAAGGEMTPPDMSSDMGNGMMSGDGRPESGNMPDNGMPNGGQMQGNRFPSDGQGDMTQDGAQDKWQGGNFSQGGEQAMPDNMPVADSGGFYESTGSRVNDWITVGVCGAVLIAAIAITACGGKLARRMRRKNKAY